MKCNQSNPVSFNKMFRRPLARRRGIALVYAVIFIGISASIISLGVDLGRVVVDKTQLRTLVDASARQGAMGLNNIIFGVSAAQANALAVLTAHQQAYQNAHDVTDASNFTFTSSNVETGIWSTANKTFTPNADPTVCNAVRVTATYNVPTIFFALIPNGRPTYAISAQSVALLTPGASITQTVPATSNPFLAGAPAGTSASNPNYHNNPDYANGTNGKPNSSPVKADSSIPITPGKAMTFDGINGGANNFASTTLYSADGNLDWMVYNNYGNNSPAQDDNNIATMTGPINSLVGVFLDNSTINNRSTPSEPDFTSDASRNQTTYQPAVNQIFFIGDGRTDGGSVQQFIVPSGATRLYIGTWDEYEWNNNVGSFTITLHAQSTVAIVQ